LELYATRRSTIFFNLLLNDGEEKTKCFLQKDPSSWITDKVYQEMNTRVQNLAVVNDCAERAVALIQAYNHSMTKDEVQKQYLVRVVALHRKQIKDFKKATLKKMIKCT